jgi:hypothetical protein
MTKLSDTQAILLSAAAQRPDGNLLPLPGSLRGGAAAKVVAALLARGLAAEHIIDSPRQADSAMNAIWRNEDDGRTVLLIITAAGVEAIGIEPATAPRASDTNASDEPAFTPTGADAAPEEPARKSGPRAPKAPRGADSAPARKHRDGTKEARLIAMLRRKEGATIPQIVDALGWQPHTVRGAFAGALKKRRGLTVTSEKVDGTRVYRLPIEG